MAKTENEVSPEQARSWGEDVARIFWGYMGREYLTLDDIVFLRDQYCVEAQAQKDITAKLERLDGGDPWTDKEFPKEFRRIMGQQWLLLLKSLDPLTRAAILATGLDKLYKAYPLYDERIWIGWIKSGKHGYVTGLQDSGKTDFICRIAEVHMRHGGTVVSTVPLLDDAECPERYIPIRLGTQMVRTACELKRQGIDVLSLRDEAFIHASGESPAATPAMKFRKMFRLFRKLGISDLSASQFDSDILRDIRRDSMFSARKVSKIDKDRAHVEMAYTEIRDGGDEPIWKFKEGFCEYVRAIPKTTIPFNTNAIATFEMDFEPDLLMKHLNRLPPGTDQYQAVIEWLDSEGFVVSDEYWKYFVQRAYPILKPKGVSYADLAKVTGKSPTTIGNWVNAAETA